MENDIYDSEDFIFNFREYSIENEENYKAAQVDVQLSQTLIDEILALMEQILKIVNDSKQQQTTKFVFDFLLQSLLKKQTFLIANMLKYTENRD